MAIQTTQPIRHTPTNAPLPESFKLVDTVIKRRMVMSIEGDWGTGKTDLALTAPGPIAFFKFDLNSEFTLKKFAGKKKIYQLEYPIPDAEADDRQKQAQAQQVMTKFRSDYTAAVNSTEIRTVIWDTATEIWEQVRLESFGKLTNVMPHHYVQVNNSFRRMIRQAFDSDTNLILIHRLKDEWVNVPDPKNPGQEKGRRTGGKERAGFSDIGFACQVMVKAFFVEGDPSPFQMKVLKCTQNPLITGQVYQQIGDMRMNSFPYLALDVFPGTGLEEWQ